MSLESVVITWDAFTPCLSHAMSNEKQEIMGLLLGSVKPSENEEGREVAIIRRSIVLQRKDKKADRVEVGSEYLALASTIAEKVSAADIETTGDIKVLGWYHSHPHITVLPSHVDVGTQGRYQRYVDHGFVGLILSVFDRGNIEICAFQSRQVEENGPWERIEIPISLQLCNKIDTQIAQHGINIQLPGKISLETMYAMQKALLNEDASAFRELYKGFQVRPPATYVSRNCLAYQTALMRTLDLQLAPLENVVSSKRESLEVEKKRLLAKLEELQGKKSGEIMELESKALSSSSGNLYAFDKVQEALDLTITVFKECSHLFQTFFIGGLYGKILTSSANLLQVNEDVVVMLQPYIDIYYSNASISTSISPWQVVLKKAEGKREIMGFLMDIKVIDNKLDFHVKVNSNDDCTSNDMIMFSVRSTDALWPINEEYLCDRDSGYLARTLQLWTRR